jgi:hypothetical protein
MRKVMADLKADVESGDMSLEERLVDMNIDPAEYKAYAQPYLRKSQGSC